MQPELPSIPEVAQPEPTPADDASKIKPSPIVEKKQSKFNTTAILLRLLIIILVAAVVGLGYWTYTLNTKLVETQQQLTTLQGEHDKLQTAYATLTSADKKLITDLAQSRTDLEMANADLTAAKNGLKKWQTISQDLNIKIDKASKLSEVLYAWSISSEPSDILEINSLIKESGDELLIKQWGDVTRSFSKDDFEKFMDYLIRAIRNSLQ